MNEERITQDTVLEMVSNGLVKGSFETAFGLAVVRTALVNAVPTFTVTFPEMEEKWAVVNGSVTGVRFTAADKDAGKPEPVIAAPEPTRIKDQGSRIKTYDPDGVKKQALKLTKDIQNIIEKEEERMNGHKLIAPKVKRPLTKDAREAKQGVIKERPPTVRAYLGRPVVKAEGKAVYRGGALIPVPTVSKKTGPVPKIGAKIKKPEWRRQLGYTAKPEKIDINLYPCKIICKECGQPRYTDKRNANHPFHPVVLCKPCQRRKKNADHTAMLRARTIAKREALEKEAAARLAIAAKKKRSRDKG